MSAVLGAAPGTRSYRDRRAHLLEGPPAHPSVVLPRVDGAGALFAGALGHRRLHLSQIRDRAGAEPYRASSSPPMGQFRPGVEPGLHRCRHGEQRHPHARDHCRGVRHRRLCRLRHGSARPARLQFRDRLPDLYCRAAAPALPGTAVLLMDAPAPVQHAHRRDHHLLGHFLALRHPVVDGRSCFPYHGTSRRPLGSTGPARFASSGK